MLRPGNAGSNTAADHIEAVRLALAQLPAAARRRVLIRADSPGGTHGFLEWLARRRLQCSAGFTITDDMQPAIMRLPAAAWTPAYDGAGRVRDGAWVAELTGLLNLSSWPEGMRVIVRKERPHRGAQLRFTDVGGHRFTAFATSARTGQLADLELRHRRRARCEDRIRCAKDTGLRCLPLHGYDQNQIWCQIVALACELPASACASPHGGHGKPRSPTPSPGCKHSHPANPDPSSLRLGRRNQGPWNPAHPARQPGRQP
jgi:Transposase DDE domain group 1